MAATSMFSPRLSTGVLRLRRPPTHFGGARMILNRTSSCTPPQPVFNRWDRKTWYKTTVPLAELWSCDWENWGNASYFHDAYSGLSPEAMHLTWWRIPGEIYPLAFLPHWFMPEPTYVFVADGRYYWAQYSNLKRIEGPFASHDDFLRRLGEDKRMYEQGTQIPNVLEEEIEEIAAGHLPD
ncbi:hypothetical protein C8F04DRAFT_1095410 [Mycena alexandri]|uniref:Uncharacterized protein n=1 Tax=Mycena alexandri TaxID=1745969 RepID=A0AAD6SZ01_9AGAR|nr:hypothetical protein C8F04DRAFT_1095410 [Mycena alexandri]